MRPRFGANLSAICCLFLASSLLAESSLLSLRNNPFSRPEALNAPPPSPKPVPRVVLPPEKVVLDLTATLVSETTPMVVIGGELIAIGEKIEGFELIAVMEGEAIFIRAGKKFSFIIDDERPK